MTIGDIQTEISGTFTLRWLHTRVASNYHPNLYLYLFFCHQIRSYDNKAVGGLYIYGWKTCYFAPKKSNKNESIRISYLLNIIIDIDRKEQLDQHNSSTYTFPQRVIENTFCVRKIFGVQPKSLQVDPPPINSNVEHSKSIKGELISDNVQLYHGFSFFSWLLLFCWFSLKKLMVSRLWYEPGLRIRIRFFFSKVGS